MRSQCQSHRWSHGHDAGVILPHGFLGGTPKSHRGHSTSNFKTLCERHRRRQFCEDTYETWTQAIYPQQEVILVRIKVQKHNLDNHQRGYSKMSASVKQEAFQEEHLSTESVRRLLAPRNVRGASIPVSLGCGGSEIPACPPGLGQVWRRTRLHIQGSIVSRSQRDIIRTNSARGRGGA